VSSILFYSNNVPNRTEFVFFKKIWEMVWLHFFKAKQKTKKKYYDLRSSSFF